MRDLPLLLRHSMVRKTLIALFHLSVVSASLIYAFALRFDFHIPSQYWALILQLLPAMLFIKLIVFWSMGLADGWWRYVSMPDLLQILRANLLASVGVVVYVLFMGLTDGLPRSIILLDFLLCFFIMIGVRVSTRMIREHLDLNSRGYHSRPKSVLVVGSGTVAQSIVREIRENPKLEKAVLGYIDNDLRRQAKVIYGVPVIGTLDDMENICKRSGIDMVIVAQSSVSPKELRDIVAFCKRNKIISKILPAIGDIISGQVSLQQCRSVQLEDLLGRPSIRLDVEEINGYLHGKRILVTGAAGSIGSEICRQVAQFGPAHLVLFENAETPLFNLENELREKFPDLTITPSLSDIRDENRVSHVFWEHKPQVVFHAAAYKHVPMSEVNPLVVVKNNVMGSRCVVDASVAVGAEHFVLISTDKAVNPTNIMGATKRVAEIYVQNLVRKARTKATTVRFGNVLGSHGSVIPTFQEQIRKGGPVTVTHPEITRFFMTIPEAVQLVLQAGCMGGAGEIFLLDMGEPVKIVRLAEELIRLSGRRPYEEIEIVFTGLRPGEKLYEELLIAGEGVKATDHEKIRILEATHFSEEDLHNETEALYNAVKNADVDTLVRTLKKIVPEFHCESHETDHTLEEEMGFPVKGDKLNLVGQKGPNMTYSVINPDGRDT
ncbi:polysaccharide biosynthesis protein [Syntrophotalea acetylenivorans]|uniref:polysaccharide biosynthesis protein n=1 Tax=Syntrophotalea acetylenivorans TaxID=1842532 RepID=UPI000A579DFC|nr:nucleoside-diphosphate sugar epimerase/dehydratase [Syntrophotalea acetylenivorans]